MFVCDRLIFVCDGGGGVPTRRLFTRRGPKGSDVVVWSRGGLTIENIKRNRCDHTRMQ